MVLWGKKEKKRNDIQKNGYPKKDVKKKKR